MITKYCKKTEGNIFLEKQKDFIVIVLYSNHDIFPFLMYLNKTKWENWQFINFFSIERAHTATICNGCSHMFKPAEQ